MKYDEHYLDEPMVKPLGPLGFRFPYDVEGWLTPAEGAELADLATSQHVLEVGSYCGKSTICMAQTAETVTSVDYHDGRGTGAPMDTAAAFAGNLKKYECENVLSVKPGKELRRLFGLVFLDGDHTVEQVRQDIALALDHLEPGGLVVFHDYRTQPGEYDGRWDPGVTEAVDELLAGGAELVRRVGTLAVVRPQLQLAGE